MSSINNDMNVENGSSSDSESCVEIRVNDEDELPSRAPIQDDSSKYDLSASIPAVEADFWMVTRQAQCGANLSERMMSFMKAITACQSEFAEKLAAISAAELARAKPSLEDAAVYHEYWVQLQLVMRLCRTWSQSSKEMTNSIGQLLTPMDRIVHTGRARLKECAVWNVELNKALSVFHTNVAKRQAKCFKALSVVMTPEYFDQSPARKTNAVRRAAPTVAKYVEEIEHANAWITKYMSQRPALKNRLETLEMKRIELTRNALTTFSTQVKLMGSVMVDTANEIASGVANIDDIACKVGFINSCKMQPTPHLENPALFEYTLPVPISELGLRPIRAPRPPVNEPINVTTTSDEYAAPSVSQPTTAVQSSIEEVSVGKRFSTLANMVFGSQQQQAKPVRNQSSNIRRSETSSEDAEIGNDLLDSEDTAANRVVERSVGMAMPSENITRFGNIVVRNEAGPNSSALQTLAKPRGAKPIESEAAIIA